MGGVIHQLPGKLVYVRCSTINISEYEKGREGVLWNIAKNSSNHDAGGPEVYSLNFGVISHPVQLSFSAGALD